MKRLAEGSTFGRYTILGTLGQGGMGIVYRALDPSLGKEVALKLLLVPAEGKHRFGERFRREAEAARAVSHPNIVSCLDAGSEGETPYLVLELVPGGSLKERLERERRLPWREVASIGAKLARALEAIHAAGFVHRDVKPANVLLDKRGTPLLADFGLVRAEAGERLTRTGELVGTIDYMSPEQTGTGNVGPGADLYALGATLYHLLTGAPPFTGLGVVLLAKHLHEKPRSAALVEPSVPAALDAIVLRLLAKDPAARGTAAEVAEELERLERSSPHARARRWPILAFAVAFALAIVGLAVAATWETPAVAPPRAEAPPPGRHLPDAPAWYLALPEDERPRLPLPKGLRFGATAGEYVNERDGSVLVHVAGGPFLMQRRVRVTLSPYFIGKYEVTVAQYRAFTGKTHHAPTTQPRLYRLFKDEEGIWNDGFSPVDATWERPTGEAPAPDQHPVTQVTWDDADVYCSWAGLALPTEAQWERAAAGVDPRSFPWGDEIPSRTSAPLANVMDRRWLERFPDLEAEIRRPDASGLPAIFEDFDHGMPAGPCPVGSFPAGASPVGALDMAGNVREWVADWRDNDFWSDPASATQESDPLRAKPPPGRKPMRVVRGGSWNHPVRTAFTTYRASQFPELANDVTGFRVALVEKR